MCHTNEAWSMVSGTWQPVQADAGSPCNRNPWVRCQQSGGVLVWLPYSWWNLRFYDICTVISMAHNLLPSACTHLSYPAKKNSVRSKAQSYVCHKISIQSALSAVASMDRLLNSPTWHATQKKTTEFHVLWRCGIWWKTSMMTGLSGL